MNGIRTHTLVVTGTDCTGSCKSNYHTITATSALIFDKTLKSMFDVSISLVIPCITYTFDNEKKYRLDKKLIYTYRDKYTFIKFIYK